MQRTARDVRSELQIRMDGDDVSAESSPATTSAELLEAGGTHIRWQPRKKSAPVYEWVRVAVLTRVTARVALLALLGPFVCRRFGVSGQTFDPALLSLLIATPAAFLISAAFQRRERAMQDLADLRTFAVSLFRALGQYGSADQAAAGQRAVQGCYAQFTLHLRTYDPAALEETYRSLKAISRAIELLRLEPTEAVRCVLAPTYHSPSVVLAVAHPQPPATRPASPRRPHIETVVGRLLFDERNLVRVIEALRLVRSFRTPAILRGFLLASCTCLPIFQVRARAASPAPPATPLPLAPPPQSAVRHSHRVLEPPDPPRS